jgi:VanZ family protein
MALIAAGSSNALSGNRTGSWMLTLLGYIAPWASPALVSGLHVALRKLGHLVEFGILAILWYRALTPRPRAAMMAFAITAAYGGVDELRQWFTPSREPAVTDVMVDGLGAVLGLAAWTEAGRLPSATLRGAAWGTALLAGVAALGVLVDAALGRPVATLAAAALGLGVVAAGMARLARDARGRMVANPPDSRSL